MARLPRRPGAAERHAAAGQAAGGVMVELHSSWRRPSLKAAALLMLIGAMQATLPAAVAIIIRRQWMRWRLGKLSAARSFARLSARHLFRLGVTLEAYFLLYYLWQKHRLSEVDIHLPPGRRRESPGHRGRYLERMLLCFDEISCGMAWRRPAGSLAAAAPLGAKLPRLAARASAARLNANQGTAASADALLERMSADVPRTGSCLPGAGAIRRQPSCQAPSSEDLLRWACEPDREGDGEDEEVLRLSCKRAELSGWFFKAPIQQIARGNIAEWVAEYLFHNSSVAAVCQDPEQAWELNELVDRVVSWAHLDTMAKDSEPNPQVRCMRLNHDPLPSAHRPFWVYLITHLVLPQVTKFKLRSMGFRRFRAGAMVYWLRPGSGQRPAGGRRAAPLLFVHGLGIGMLPYLAFVRELAAQSPEADVFCVDMPHVQMRPCEEVPSAREMCACVGDMLQAWGHTSAHIVGHSFGTVVCSWLMRLSPAAVQSVSLLDPVCFLLCKSDLIFNALYSQTASPFHDPGTWLLSFLIFRELYVCHTLMRNFFWQENILWPEDLRGLPAFVLLSGRDSLVPAHSVRQVLLAESERRRLAAEAQQSGGAVVIQSGPTFMPEVSADAGYGAPRGRNEVELLRVGFVPEAIHGQFWRDPAMMREVLLEVKATMQRAAGHLPDAHGARGSDADAL